MKATIITLSVIYLLALMPVLFLGWAAYSDYEYRGCPGEGTGQCGDAETMMRFVAAYLTSGFILLIIRRLVRLRKVVTNA